MGKVPCPNGVLPKEYAQLIEDRVEFGLFDSHGLI